MNESKMNTLKHGRVQDTLIYMMFRRRFDVSTKFTDMMSNHLSSHKTSRGILPRTPPANSTLPTPGGRKSQSHWANCLSKAVECTGALRRHGGPWHWGRGRRRCSRRRHTFHRPGRSIPMCGYCALRAPFRSGTADSSDWPGESVAQNPITILALQKWSWPLGRNLPRFCFFQLPPLSFVVEMGWNAFSHETSPNPKSNLRRTSARKACIAFMSVHFRDRV